MTVVRFILLLVRLGSLLTVAPSGVIAGDQPQSSATDRIVRDTNDAVAATKQYTLQQKEAFQKTIQVELNELHTKIAELQKKTSAASVEARGKCRKRFRILKKRRTRPARNLKR